MAYKILLAGLLAAVAGAGSAASAQGGLRVGAAKVDISPAPSLFPSAAQRNHMFVGVHDPLYARAIMVDDGRARAVIVALDATRVPAPAEMTKRIAAAAGVPEKNVLLTATHTHSDLLVTYHGMVRGTDQKPSPQQAAYIAQMTDRAAEAARLARDGLQPARVEFGRGKAYMNVNDGAIRTGHEAGYDPDGASDKSLDVIKFDNPAGEPIAIFMNYAVHAETIFGSVTRGTNGEEVSADLPGATVRFVEDHYKQKPVAMWTMGAAADQFPIFTARRPDGGDEGAGNWAVLDVMAARIGKTVVDIVDAARHPETSARVRVGQKTVTCPGQTYTRVPNTVQLTPGSGPAAPVPITVSLLAINDIALVGVSAEVATTIGMHLKQVSPLPHTTMITLVGQDIGYLFADERFDRQAGKLLEDPVVRGCADGAVLGAAVELINGH